MRARLRQKVWDAAFDTAARGRTVPDGAVVGPSRAEHVGVRARRPLDLALGGGVVGVRQVVVADLAPGARRHGHLAEHQAEQVAMTTASRRPAPTARSLLDQLGERLV
eukprot:4982357-Prymnesium_polylepis.1